MLFKTFTLLSLSFFLFGFVQDASAGDWQKTKGVYAVFNTSMGKIVCRLFADDAPETVANFIGLAEGTKEWTGTDGKKTKAKLYDGTKFHRIIKDFMIQGGDPAGNGTGGPGFSFKDEFGSGRTFDKPGLLAMANRGPATNGSQFFITHVPTPWLNNKHTIFGETIEGQDIVDKMATVPMQGSGRRDPRASIPKTPIILETLEIVRVDK
ncbi:peptidylprolyl isomerase, partial [Thermodesulfobacteriota bacterium]